jgi:uncharacterized protein YjiS (DUF1127 family)
MTIVTHDRFAAVAGAARQTAPARPGVLAGLGATLRTWRRRIEERDMLASFGMRDLSDIGISRADALREINKPFWKA